MGKKKTGKHGKNKRFSTYGNQKINLQKFKSKKNRGYKGPRIKVGYEIPIEYKNWQQKRTDYYSSKLSLKVCVNNKKVIKTIRSGEQKRT